MSAITELTNIYTALDNYYSDLATSISTGANPPDIQPLLTGMANAELVTYCSNLSEGSAGFSVGAAQEAAITAYAIQREFDYCNVNKSEIYDNCVSDNEEEARFYDEAGAFHLGILKGAPTSGVKS